MLISQMLDNDVENCRDVMEGDEELQNLESNFYAAISKLPEEDRYEMEDLFSGYAGRVTRIAYLKGMSDFARLCITLKESDIKDILKEM